jgi:hypothetical protein
MSQAFYRGLNLARSAPDSLLGGRCLLRLSSFLRGYAMADVGDEPKELRAWVVGQLGFDNLTADAITLVRMVSENDQVAYERYLELVDLFRVFKRDEPTTTSTSEVTQEYSGRAASVLIKQLCQRPQMYLPRLSVTCLMCFARGYEMACEINKRPDLLDVPMVQLLGSHGGVVPGQRPERVAELEQSEERILHLELRNLATAAGIDWSDCQPRFTPGRPRGVTIRKHDLLRALAAALEAIGQALPDEFAITNDYYWKIPPTKRYQLDLPAPSTLTMGQISHDWERLSSVDASSEVIPQTFSWAAGVLEAMSHEDGIVDALLSS